MSNSIHVLNAGSSSLKFCVYVAQVGGWRAAARGQVEGIGTTPRLLAKDEGGTVLAEKDLDAGVRDARGALETLTGWLRGRFAGSPVLGVGHRVVHGGPEFDRPVRIDDAVLERLARYQTLAPLHQPNNLAPIRLAMEIAPEVPQVACFDTAFHRGHAPHTDCYALPRAFYDEGIRRYGFHGLSYEYIAQRLPEVAPEIAGGRVIVAHLGSGASLCALRERRSVATTMGFSTLDGLLMATRCGTLDPGVPLYLMQARGMDAAAIADLLYQRSGLLGVSGLSGDMRTLRASTEPAAREAVDLFCYRVCREIGSLAAALGGVDALVFTGGIGEHAHEIRERICAELSWLGPNLRTLTLATDEEQVIARHTARLCS